MILLDTNVISEMMKQKPNLAVLNWLDTQDKELIFISTITCAELHYGISAMAQGKRRSTLSEILNNILNMFSERTLSFDLNSAASSAELAIKARAAGKGFPTPDGYIASVAHANGLSVATRDTSPFLAAGLQVINPWGFGD